MSARNLFQLVGVLVLSLFLVQCKEKGKDKVKKKVTQEMKELVVDATDYKSWVYFSFEKGQVVATKDVHESFAKDAGWDIAFHRYDFRTNGGASGSHKGAVAETQETDMSKEIPMPAESAFKKDEIGSLIVFFEVGENGKHDIKRAQIPVNYVLTTRKGEHIGAISSDGMPPVVKLSKKVYIVKTASGKLVKFKVTDYRNAHGKTGHIKFQYAFVAEK